MNFVGAAAATVVFVVVAAGRIVGCRGSVVLDSGVRDTSQPRKVHAGTSNNVGWLNQLRIFLVQEMVGVPLWWFSRRSIVLDTR